MTRFDHLHDYVERKRAVPLAFREHETDTLLRRMALLRPIAAGDSLLELGSGTGWLLVMAAKRGIRCTGIEHNPDLVDASLELAREEGVEIDVRVGRVEADHVPPGQYDFAIANSLLEHVPEHRGAIAAAYRALRPGGVFALNSTNKFALRSGEYPPIRLYGWLPYPVRERIRVRAQGTSVLESGAMDSHQFTYPGLRRALSDAGFSRVLDIYDLLDVDDLNHPTRLRTAAMRAYKRLPPLKTVLTTFADGTYFFCVK